MGCVTFSRRQAPAAVRLVLVAALCGLHASATGQSEPGADPADGGQGAWRSEAEKIFQTRCFVCHGRGGKGDGPSAIGLGANPRNFTDPQWQRSTSDDRIRKVIREGGEAVGESDAMPPNGDLTGAQIDALVGYLRSLR